MPARALAILACALVLLGVPAIAAEPGGGQVSDASPLVKWKGESVGGGFTTVHAIGNGGSLACEAPSCDTFALELMNAGDLTVKATADNEAVSFVMIEIVKPDGSKLYNGGQEDKPVTRVGIRNAPAGAYSVRIALNAVQPETYTAQAGFVEDEEALDAAALELLTKSVSARKAGKRLTLSIGSSKPVRDVRATLLKGSRKLGSGKLGELGGRGKITLKLKKALARGTYTVRLGADDGRATVGGTFALKVKR